MELILYERDVPNKLSDLIEDNAFKQKVEIRKTDYHKFPIQFKDLNEELIKRNDNIGLKISEGTAIYGITNIIKYLQKGFLYRDDIRCPYNKKYCILDKCAKYVVLNEGGIQVGECSDYWTPLLIIETRRASE